MNTVPRPTREMKSAAAYLIALQAQTKTIEPIVLRIKSEILKEIGARDKNGNELTHPNDYWKMTDEYAIKYFALFDIRIKEAGFNVEPGISPLLVAQNQEMEAAKAFNRLACKLMPDHLQVVLDVDNIYNKEDFDKLTSLNLQYVLGSK